jgi:hypothetical protein
MSSSFFASPEIVSESESVEEGGFECIDDFDVEGNEAIIEN